MMTDKEIGEELLERKGSMGPFPTTEATSLIIRKANRLYWTLGGLTIALWALAAVAFAVSVRSFFVFIYPILVEWALQIEPQGLDGRVQVIPLLCLVATYIWVALLGLAATATKSHCLTQL